jgi:hypothetical protein
MTDIDAAVKMAQDILPKLPNSDYEDDGEHVGVLCRALLALHAENERLKAGQFSPYVHGVQHASLIADRDRLRAALNGMLASASPNERDHPSMHAAWAKAERALAGNDGIYCKTCKESCADAYDAEFRRDHAGSTCVLRKLAEGGE